MLPIIDLDALHEGASNGEEVASFRAALRRGATAFTVRAGSLVPPALVERAYEHTASLHALPTAAKAPLHFSRHGDGRGWVPLHAEGSYEAGDVASHVESYDLGRPLPRTHPAVVAKLSGCAPNVYPPEDLCPGFEADIEALNVALARTAAIVLAALPLGDDGPAHIARLYREDTSLGKLRLMRYPGAGTGGSPAVATASNHGVSSHTDFEAITFLHQSAPALQLRLCGEWFEAPTPGGGEWTLIVSDMIEAREKRTCACAPIR